MNICKKRSLKIKIVNGILFIRIDVEERRSLAYIKKESVVAK